MSTRATYEFHWSSETSHHGRTTPVTYYIHHDGYPRGACHYLLAAINHPNKRGSLAERFLRANDGAEFTEGHEHHGDTEYQYTIEERAKEAPLLAVVTPKGFDDKRTLSGYFTGTLQDFIAAEREKDHMPGEQLVSVGSVLMTIDEAYAYASTKLADCCAWYVEGSIGNSSGALAMIKPYIAALESRYKRLRTQSDNLEKMLKAAYAK